VCTVLLRLTPGARWPLLLAAVRDEFMERPWDPPAAHWPAAPRVWGGRDRTAGGTWLAVDRERPAVAALLNGARRGDPPDGVPRPTRGTLALAALADAPGAVPGIADGAALARYDGFHLLRADFGGAEVWSWDGESLEHLKLDPGDHIIVNLGPDRADDPLIPHFMPLFGALATPDPVPGGPTGAAWPGWVDLLRGDGLGATDPRGLIIDHEFDGHHYGSTSATLVALGADGRVRYDFTATPASPEWYEVPDSDG
jgi:hypothetical protein